ncbi:4-hydroxybenzoate octaprenyltransferase [Bartonella sp. TP]|uniref:4-hydroxybenzoate octaprenyltransferase n=1 Tax=Bartonella sp. TP TaxID=3057550 RepID=UPI0025AF8259|nr:4-hydroxybenzoate octaprenyltransferase [Bartonella sp. TP]WJW80203.1 4-hydroxybenzoate octaprenyltransferase [Bartonella sp. TP]
MNIRANLVKDSCPKHWVYHYLPNNLIAYAQLARWDRPVGWQLLLAPCLVSLFLAFASEKALAAAAFTKVLYYALLFCFGAIAMRGAACTLNDIVDIDIDMQVERTQQRPLASGAISKAQAVIFMLLQCSVGLIILLQFNKLTIWLGLSSILVCIIYPFMKRITNCPQFFLGLAFGWGALLGWSALLNNLSVSAILLYCGCAFWIVGYDTIYACQDMRDDIKIGVGSTALLFKDNLVLAVGLFYSFFVLFLAAAFYSASVPYFAYIGLVAALFQLGWQIYKLDMYSESVCLRLFKTNVHTGLILCGALLLAALRI